jgi:hypothetical protein
LREARFAAGCAEVTGLLQTFHEERIPCATSNDDSECEVAPPIPRLVPQNGQ